MSWRTGTWDYTTIDGVRLIGQTKDLRINPKRNIESTPVPKKDGVNLKDQGYTGSPVVITQRVFRSRDFDLLAAQLAQFNPRQPGIAIKPHAIDHPITRLANITHIYIDGYECGMPDDDGTWTVNISAFQFCVVKDASKAVPLSSGGGSLDIDTDVKPNPAGVGAHFP